MTRPERIPLWLLTLLAVLAGAVLRLSFSGDIEYKSDEAYMFEKALQIRMNKEPWPWLGVNSGVMVKNPGLSVWIFVALSFIAGKISGHNDPIALAQSVQCLNILALGLLFFFTFRIIHPPERKTWLWATILASVNPFAVLYHRKIWAQSVLPFFSMLFLMSWWKRDRKWGAFFWGFIGAALGQIHMSGFFFAAAFFLWALIFESHLVKWKSWLLGSTLGAIPLLPWFVHLYEYMGSDLKNPATPGIHEAIQLKFWVYWITDALGQNLANTLGLHRGTGNLTQIGDFLRYPLIGHQATYLVGAAHLLTALVGIVILSQVFRHSDRSDLNVSPGTRTTLNAAFWGYGTLLTLSLLAIRRHYLLITFPLEFVWLARLSASRPRWLGILAIGQLFISINFLYYIHKNQGAPQGDFGTSYSGLLKQNSEQDPHHEQRE